MLRPHGKRDSEKEFHGPIATDQFEQLPNQLLYAWEQAYSRAPTEEELRLSVGFVANQLKRTAG